MTPDADEEISAYVRLLATRFVKRTVGELPEQRANYVRLSAGDAVALDPLRRWAHRLHGTSGSLGLRALSAHSNDLEQLLQPKTIPDAPTLQRVFDLMRAIEQALAGHAAQESHD